MVIGNKKVGDNFSLERSFMKKIFFGFLIFCMLEVVNARYVSLNTLKYNPAYNEKNPYTKAGYYGQCTWYAWGRMFEKTGFALPARMGNAKDWYSSIKEEYKRDEIEPNSIIVIGSGSYSKLGHVLFVEDIKGDDVYITEGNSDGSGNIKGYKETKRKLSTLKVGKAYYKNQNNKILGFISSKKKYKPNGKKIDLGTNFLARIIPKKEMGYALSYKNKKITLETNLNGDNSQNWFFQRNKDGSYQIKNAFNNKKLVIDNNVDWFFYEFNNGIRIVSKNHLNEMLALDIPNNYAFIGQNLQLYEALHKSNEAQTFLIEKTQEKVVYTTHMEYYGWNGRAENGKTSGSTTEKKRLEAIEIHLENMMEKGSIEYLTHLEVDGWGNWQKENSISGTTGKSKRLEAIKIRLTGDIEKKYNIYYRAYIENYGWLDWAKNGEIAGSTGQSLKMEAIEIKLLRKNQLAPGKTKRAYLKPDNTKVVVKAKNTPITNIKIELENQGFSGNILYRVFTNTGWSIWHKDGESIETTEKNPIKKIEIRLTKTLKEEYDIYCRVKDQNGWSDWQKNKILGQKDSIRNGQVTLIRKNVV